MVSIQAWLNLIQAVGMNATQVVCQYICGTENKQEGEVHKHYTKLGRSQRYAGTLETESDKSCATVSRFP